MMFKVRFLIAFILLFVVTTFQLGSVPEGKSLKHSKYIAEPTSPSEIKWVDSVMSVLTPRERIAQLLMIPAYSNLGEKHENSVKSEIENNKVGGLIFFQGTPKKQAELTNLYQSVSKVPLIIGMDAEWGVAMRLNNVISFPRQMALGSIRDNSLIYDLGAEFARQCKLLGVHINFAPSVDVNNNINNPVINFRSFGENPDEVTAKGIAIMQGMQDNGIIACAKHFPGHGDTDVDSHHALPVLEHTRDRLETIEFEPFKGLINEGVSMVMIGHLYATSLEKNGENIPASISESVIQKVLRNDLNFEGLVVSDALNMNGVKDYLNGKNIAVEAIKAGHDILLMPCESLACSMTNNIEEVEKAIKKGVLTQKQIDDKCRKVLTVKYRVGLKQFEPLDTKNIQENLNSPDAQALKNRLVENSITLVRNNENLLPLKDLDRYKYGYLAVGGFKQGTSFLERLQMYTKISAKAEVSKTPTAKEIEDAKASLKDCDVVIVGYHSTSTSPKQNYGVNKTAFDLVKSIAPNKKIVLSYFGSPYFLSKVSDISTYTTSVIVAHDNSDEAQDRTAQLIFDGIPFSGKMPVTATTEFKEGWGIETYNATRLKYVTPEEIGLSSTNLKSVDSLVNIGISKKAFPGCQVIAAHKGNVFYYKAFGNHTYDKGSADTKITDVFDVASVTKVAATIPLVMRMVDEELININQPLNKYIGLYPYSNKGKLKIKDILLHQSGLPSWIPFHYKYFVTADGKSAMSTKKTAEYSVELAPKSGRYLKPSYTIDKKYFSNSETDKFCCPIANNIYGCEALRNDIYAVMDTCKLMNTNYRYSDLGFIYMQRVIEKMYNMPEDELSQQLFYEPLGMDRTGYLPIRRGIDKKDIPPTEDDKVFRKQLLQGYVHDQCAAMSGGVSGHAGLFSNVNDLAKLYQMYLNGGTYGGVRHLSEETIAEFTACANCKQGNRRGLGFDKQEPNPAKKSTVCKEASLQSYGHTGFTGAMVWVDPERDLVYVFLSNRIHPNADNNKLSTLGTRSEILARFINAIDEKKIEEI